MRSGACVLILCPAKINQFLSVGPIDERGYHPIRTIFQTIALYDELQVEAAERDSFTCNWPLPERNTVTKAWNLLREFTHLPPLRVTLTKNIPEQSGLGGGSSDAAGFLKEANRIATHKVKEEDLHEIAKAIGADVPFFLLGGRAKGEGYGEILTPLPQADTRWLVLAKPDVQCSTAEMYRKLDEHPQPFLHFPSGGELFNAFEAVAPCECLELIEFLKHRGAQAGLTGSGSAVFGYCGDEQSAKHLVNELSSNFGIWAIATHTAD